MANRREIIGKENFEDQIKDHYEGKIETSQVGDASDTKIGASKNLAEKANTGSVFSLVDFEKSGEEIVSQVMRVAIGQSEFVPNTVSEEVHDIPEEEDPFEVRKFIAQESVSPHSLDGHVVKKHSAAGGRVLTRPNGNLKHK